MYSVKTDPSDADTDDDGLPDGQEKYVRDFAMPVRKTAGTDLWVALPTSISGAIERVDVRYGLSTIAISNFVVELKKGASTIVFVAFAATEAGIVSHLVTNEYGFKYP